MKITPLKLKGAFLIEPKINCDERGYFFESFRFDKISQFVNFKPVQDNQSFTKQKNTIRGLHTQIGEFAQSKLIRCTKGTLIDVIVDIRRNSPTYLQHEMIELSEDNFYQVFIPKGFLHGFLTKTDEVIIEYKVDQYYHQDTDRTVRFDDPELKINWGIKNPIVSSRDKQALQYHQLDFEFKFEQ